MVLSSLNKLSNVFICFVVCMMFSIHTLGQVTISTNEPLFFQCNTNETSSTLECVLRSHFYITDIISRPFAVHFDDHSETINIFLAKPKGYSFNPNEEKDDQSVVEYYDPDQQKIWFYTVVPFWENIISNGFNYIESHCGENPINIETRPSSHVLNQVTKEELGYTNPTRLHSPINIYPFLARGALDYINPFHPHGQAPLNCLLYWMEHENDQELQMLTIPYSMRDVYTILQEKINTNSMYYDELSELSLPYLPDIKLPKVHGLRFYLHDNKGRPWFLLGHAYNDNFEFTPPSINEVMTQILRGFDFIEEY